MFLICFTRPATVLAEKSPRLSYRSFPIEKKMNRLFIVIGRINSVLLLLVLIGAAVSVSWMTLENNRWQRRGAVEVAEAGPGTKSPVLLSFERIENIPGADTQMMRLTTQERSAKFSSGGYGGEIRNVLFLSGTEKTARWLFKDHKNLVLVTDQLREEASRSKEQPPAKALYFEYVTHDTNQDGSLSSQDNSNIGLARPNGTGLLEVLHDVSRVLSYEMTEQGQLSVVYQKGTTVRHARFSLTTMKLEADQKIVNVPSTL